MLIQSRPMKELEIEIYGEALDDEFEEFYVYEL